MLYLLKDWKGGKLMKWVYEVIYTNIHNGSRGSDYFDSERAAKRWKECKERGGNNVAEIAKWRVWSNKDI